jgi:hypothetical protein
MEHFFAVAARTPGHARCEPAQLIGEPLADGGDAVCHTFLHHLRPLPLRPPASLPCFQQLQVPRPRPKLPMVVLSKSLPGGSAGGGSGTAGGGGGCGGSSSLPPPVAVVVRHFIEIEPMGSANMAELWQALARWECWRAERDAQVSGRARACVLDFLHFLRFLLRFFRSLRFLALSIAHTYARTNLVLLLLLLLLFIFSVLFLSARTHVYICMYIYVCVYVCRRTGSV